MTNSEVVVPVLLSLCGATLFFARFDDGYSFRREFRARVSRINDRSGVRGRLKMLGLEADYEKFRLTQVVHSLSSCLFVFLAMSLFQDAILTSGILAMFGGFVVFFYEDRKLSTQVRRQRLQIEAEFASVIEMMTLALSAGETPLGAFQRISQRSDGLFSRQLLVVLEAVKSGTSFQVALDEMGRRIESNQIRRFIDALLIAMMRGAPLIEILHTHVAEARSIQKNLIMNRAGKAEMSMMIPVVFLILPISVLFALWPSLNNLNIFAS